VAQQNGDPSEDDLNTKIGERESENKCTIEIDTDDTGRVCPFSNKAKHGIMLQYDANVKRGDKYSGACQLIQTCDEGEGAPADCLCTSVVYSKLSRERRRTRSTR
jgi:hypothetical protein